MRGLAKATMQLISYANQLLADVHPMTLRQLHYAIFSRKGIPYDNTPADYRRLSRATTMARRAFRDWELQGGDPALPPEFGIDPALMVDETRELESVSVWQNAEEYIEQVKRSYRRNNWQDQQNYCEVWSEKATILRSIRSVVDRLGVTVGVCHGFGSTGMESRIGEAFESITKPITVFFLGDHDPSGRIIEEDIHRRAERAAGVTFRMIRLAIHPEDIRRFALPPQRIKASDSRAGSFQRRFGNNAPTVELDALPVHELRRRVEEAVLDLIDHDLWQRQVEVQRVELECISRFAERVKRLPQVNP